MGATGTKDSFSMLSGRDILGDLDDLPAFTVLSARLPFDTDLLTKEVVFVNFEIIIVSVSLRLPLTASFIFFLSFIRNYQFGRKIVVRRAR